MAMFRAEDLQNQGSTCGRLAGLDRPVRMALAQPLHCGCQQHASFSSVMLCAWPWASRHQPCPATTTVWVKRTLHVQHSSPISGPGPWRASTYGKLRFRTCHVKFAAEPGISTSQAANSRALCDFCYSGNARNAKLGEGVPELPVVMQGPRQE